MRTSSQILEAFARAVARTPSLYWPSLYWPSLYWMVPIPPPYRQQGPRTQVRP